MASKGSLNLFPQEYAGNIMRGQSSHFHQKLIESDRNFTESHQALLKCDEGLFEIKSAIQNEHLKRRLFKTFR